MKRVTMAASAATLMLVASAAGAQIRIPGRPAVPPTIPTPSPAPRPTINSNAPVSGKVGAQAQCLYTLVAALGPQRTASGTTDMLCMIGGKPVSKTFRFGPPGVNPEPNSPLGQIIANQNRGFVSLVTYSQAPTGTDAKGQPIYDIYSVGEGMQSLSKVTCARLNDETSTSLRVGYLKSDTTVRLWCGDGTRVVPITFTISPLFTYNPDRVYNEIVEDRVTNGSAVVQYQSFTSGGNPDAAMLISDATGQGNVGSIACSIQSTDPDAKFCVSQSWSPGGDSQNPSVSTEINYPVFVTPAMKASRTGKPTKPSYLTKFYRYFVLPGVVPIKYRGEAGGNCYVAGSTVVEFTYSAGVGVGRASPDGPFAAPPPTSSSVPTPPVRKLYPSCPTL